MPTITADFGIVLAYIVPGLLCLWAITLLSDDLERIFYQAREGEKRALSLFLLLSISLVGGMIISIVRAGTIDNSFRVLVPFCNVVKNPECGSIKREDPSIEALSCEGPREAFLLLESRDKRPYQFYGNMVLACSIIAGSFIASLLAQKDRPKKIRPKIAACIALWAVVAATFYSGSRLSHYRYMAAVEDLNRLKCADDGKSVSPDTAAPTDQKAPLSGR